MTSKMYNEEWFLYYYGKNYIIMRKTKLFEILIKILIKFIVNINKAVQKKTKEEIIEDLKKKIGNTKPTIWLDCEKTSSKSQKN